MIDSYREKSWSHELRIWGSGVEPSTNLGVRSQISLGAPETVAIVDISRSVPRAATTSGARRGPQNTSAPSRIFLVEPIHWPPSLSPATRPPTVYGLTINRPSATAAIEPMQTRRSSLSNHELNVNFSSPK